MRTGQQEVSAAAGDAVTVCIHHAGDSIPVIDNFLSFYIIISYVSRLKHCSLSKSSFFLFCLFKRSFSGMGKYQLLISQEFKHMIQFDPGALVVGRDIKGVVMRGAPPDDP